MKATSINETFGHTTRHVRGFLAGQHFELCQHEDGRIELYLIEAQIPMFKGYLEEIEVNVGYYHMNPAIIEALKDAWGRERLDLDYDVALPCCDFLGRRALAL